MDDAVNVERVRGASITKSLELSPGSLSARDAAVLPLGDLLLRPWLGFALTGILCAFSLLFFVVSLLIAAVCTVPIALCAPFRRKKRSRNVHALATWHSNEFAFERAIESYEELIDEHACRRL